MASRRADADGVPRRSGSRSSRRLARPGCIACASPTATTRRCSGRSITSTRSSRSGTSRRRPGGSGRAVDARATWPTTWSELGLEPDDPPEMTSLTIARAPERASRRSRSRCAASPTPTSFMQALEIDWESFEHRRRGARAPPDGGAGGLAEVRGRRDADDLPRLRRRRAGRVRRDVFTRHGVLMLGGATLPEARGQGVYTSLVHRPLGARRRSAARSGSSSARARSRLRSSRGSASSAMGDVRLLRRPGS